MIKFVRVDHRLIHGQVAFAWTKSLGIDCILVASDSVAKDNLRMSALRMAAPSGVKVVIKSIEDSAANILSGKTDKYNLMIVLENIKDADRLTEKVTEIKKVNLGGVKKEEGKKQISKGIAVEVQMIPEDKMQNAMTLI